MNIMGRNLMKIEDRKSKITISIDVEINKQLDELKINKSKLINWLLLEHFNLVNNEKI